MVLWLEVFNIGAGIGKAELPLATFLAQPVLCQRRKAHDSKGKRGKFGALGA